MLSLKINHLHLVLGVMLLFQTACNQIYYGPSDLQVTPLRAKSDTRIGGQLSVIGEAKGAGAQTILPIGSRLAVKGQANVLYGSGYPENFFSSSFERVKISAVATNAEALLGHHRQVHEKLWIALFAGGGINRITNKYDGKYKTSLNFSRLCIQPEAVITGKYADLGFGLRSSYIDYFYGSINAQVPSWALTDYTTIEQNRKYFMTEGQLMLGGGKGRFYVRNTLTWMLHKPKQEFFGRLQFGTSLLFSLHSK